MNILTALFIYIVTVILAGIILMVIDKFDMTNLIVYLGAIIIGSIVWGALSMNSSKEKKDKKKKQEIEFL